ncbi:hypothetical protein EW145_g6386 [Phellinidium pouzarii]|uniref:RING-type E3 ubiquitin transferase n=1 Tax=Phellinidium pouzarii TaxID=167371 RepID=A0A4S4KWV4_9AGAM|nr:hypothetical protein EW145_g6386 [Phellinidium pouzarii]
MTGFGVPLNPSLASYYSNITGFVHGPIEIYNLTSALNLSSDASTHPQDPHITLEMGPEIPFTSSIPTAPKHSWEHTASEFVKDINMTSAIEHIGTWNWSAPMELAFRVLEKRPVVELPGGSSWGRSNDDGNASRMNSSLWADISLMHGRVDLVDKNTGDELGFDMEAVHFVENGTVYGFAEPSGRHVDVRDLPSLVPARYMNATAQAVNAELLARIHRLQEMVDSGVIEVDTQTAEDPPKTTCPFILFAQLVPTSVPQDLMQELEREMENPTGITTVRRPELKMNAILMSKECGIMLEMREAEGLKSQRFWRKVTTYSAVAAAAYLVMLLLFVRQTEASQTPIGISRVSRWTFLTQAAADSISFVGHVTFGILADGRPSLSLIAPAFLAAVLLVYEAQFSVLIHQIQQPEEADPSPPRPIRPSPSPVEQIAPSSIPTMTAPAVATVSEPSTLLRILPAARHAPPGRLRRQWQRMRESPQTRFWLSIVLALVFFVRVLVSPSLALLMIAGMYSNFWIPQIVRSARRGTTSGLRAEYLIGTTACRAFFALYLFACPKNVLDIDTSPLIYVIVGFVSLQAVVVLLQDYLGSGFFLPRGYSPPSQYDYHPYIPPPDAEAPEPSLGDCAICMEAILVQPDVHLRRRSLSGRSLSGRRRSNSVKEREKEKERETGMRGILDRIEASTGRSTSVAAGIGGSASKRAYALAPCHHLFVSASSL